MDEEQIPKWIVSTRSEAGETSISSHYWITARILFDTAFDEILRKGKGGHVRVAYRNAEGVEQTVIETAISVLSEG